MRGVAWGGACFCLITGASRGIGRALAVQFARNMGPGSLLVLVARDLEALRETGKLAEKTGVRIVTESADLSRLTPEDAKKLVREAAAGRDVAGFGLKMIVHNAASVGDVDKTMEQLDRPDIWQDYFNFNVFSVTFLNNAFLEAFADLPGDTVVVNVTSLAALKPFPGMPLYCTGKAAREMYFRVLAEERPDLDVLNYAPGPVETDMVRSILDNTVNADLKNTFAAMAGEGKLLKAEQTAKKCVQVLSEGKYKSGDHVDYFDEL